MAVRVRRGYGDKAAARAAAGAALLDRLVPGWWRLVKITSLDISDDCRCVTGQLFGTYGKGLTALDLDNAEAKEYGFEFKGDLGGGYWTLTRAWRDEVRKRRNGRRVGRQS